MFLRMVWVMWYPSCLERGLRRTWNNASAVAGVRTFESEEHQCGADQGGESATDAQRDERGIADSHLPARVGADHREFRKDLAGEVEAVPLVVGSPQACGERL